MTTVNELEKIVKNKIVKNELNTTNILGVKNLSRSDLEEILMYIENIKRYNDITAYGQFMKPIGNIAEVFKKINC